MDKSNNNYSCNHCKDKHTAKVLYIQDYAHRRETLKNTGVEPSPDTLEKTESNITYFDEDRQKTLDLFVRVLNTMKKENFQ